MAIEIDNQFNPDLTKKKVLVINDPIITIDGVVNQINKGNLGSIIVGSSVDSVIFTLSAIDPWAGESTTLSDDDYNYTTLFSIIPGSSSLPSTLNTFGNQTTDLSNTYDINGIITSVSKEKYEFMVRATLTCTDKDGNFVRSDNTDYYCYFDSSASAYDYHWNKIWLNSLTNRTYNSEVAYDIGIYNRGQIVNTTLQIDNLPTDLILTSKIVSNDSTLQDLGLSINSEGILSGSVNISSTPERYYLTFSGYRTSDSTDNGTPPLSDTIFSFLVNETIVPDTGETDSIIWNTDSYLGSQYETYPSFFSVSATSNNGDTISYSISPSSTSYLPTTLTLNSVSGNINGLMPYSSTGETVTFTVRASTSSVYSDKTFTFNIVEFYGSGNIVGLSIPVTDEIRRKIAVTSWDTDVILPSYVYRVDDSNFGRKYNQNIYFLKGLKDDSDNFGYWNDQETTGDSYDSIPSDGVYDNFKSCFLDKLMNYHHPYDLTITSIEYTPVYDLSSNHICDLVYFLLTDPHSGVGGFDSNGDEILINDSELNGGIPEWNIPDGSKRVFPVSVNNCRLDLINTSNRIDSPTYAVRPNATPGIGLLSNEGLPMWMLNYSSGSTNIGFTLGIEICYVVAGYGSLVKTRITDSSYYDIIGESFTVDRYIVDRNTETKIHFDLTSDTETTFDADVNNNVVDDTTGTWFDVSDTAYSTVIKFPPGDIG